MDGWFKVFRNITEWEWFNDGNTLKLWLYLLAKANYKDSHYMGIEVKRGQLLIGRKKLAERLGMTERQIRTSLNRLKSTNEVTIKTTNKYSLVSIVKYDFYQSGGDEDDQQNDQQNDQRVTIKRPADDHNLRNKERKERKNIYNSLPVYDSSKNEKMPEEQQRELLKLMGRA